MNPDVKAQLLGLTDAARAAAARVHAKRQRKLLERLAVPIAPADIGPIEAQAETNKQNEAATDWLRWIRGILGGKAK